MPQDLVFRAQSEFMSKKGINDPKANACFLWSLWVHLARDREVMDTIQRISAQFFNDLSETANADPEPGLLPQAASRKSSADLFRYLITQTLRIQRQAALEIQSVHGRTRSVRFPAMTSLPDAPDKFFLLRRPPLPIEEESNFGFQRRIPRFLFPHLRLLPSRINGTVELDLMFLPIVHEASPTGTSLDPRLFKSKAVYDVATHEAGGDVYFRVKGLKEGAAERRSELVAAAAERADGDKNLMMLWPELSVDEGVVIGFTRALQDRSSPTSSVLGAEPPPARFALPGTFHVERLKETHSPDELVLWDFVPNRAMLVDIDTGALVLEQDKIRFFKERAEGTVLSEAVLGSDKLKIGCADWGTFCILICKDFVDEEVPFVDQLDVDFILVPSMGRQNTYRAWKKMADNFKRRWGGRSALALQHPPDPENWVHIPTTDSDSVGHT